MTFETMLSLCALDGVSGREGAVRDAILAEAKRCGADCTVDPLGNLIARKKGRETPPIKLMLCAHIDEVGLIVTHVEEDGTARFAAVGGISPSVLGGRRVKLQNRAVYGAVGCKPVHLQRESEKERYPDLSDLYIDFGCRDTDEAMAIAPPGTPLVFAAEPRELSEHIITAKAIDDRAGCALLLALLRRDLPYDVTFLFSVQEEIGSRGAGAGAYTVAPDLCVVVEATTAADIAGVGESEQVTVLGAGPAISFADRGAIYDEAMTSWLQNLGRDSGIPVQQKRATAGGNDSSSIQLARGGIRTAAVSLPCRYLHSASCTLDRRDLDSAEKLLVLALERWNALW